MHCTEERGQRLAVGERKWESVANAAVEPSGALINNLLIYRSLSLKRRLQATEGCRWRKWRRADKTHSGGILSAGSPVREAYLSSREKARGREWHRGKKIQTHFFFLYINLFTG